MNNHQSELADRILERISTDKAVHEAMHRFLKELQGFRADINQLRQEMANPIPTRYLTTSEVAETFGISAETVPRRVADGKLPAMIIGRQARFGPEEIAEIRHSLVERALEPPLTSWERRQRNKRLRALGIGGQ
jgi:excisionase family DNA binding protein